MVSFFKKKKTKAVQMRMSPYDDPAVFDMRQDEEGIITNEMGGCCSVILMWGVYTTGRGFNNIRGQHGAGGPGALNWGELLRGFDRSVQNKIVMSCAPSDYANYIDRIKTQLSENRIQCRRDFLQYTNAIVWRDGSSQAYSYTTARDRNLEIRTW